MVSMIADDAVGAALGGLNEPTEIRDKNGTVLGYFTPVGHREKLYAEARSQFDPSEIRRRKAASQRDYTTQEVLEHLKSLEPS